MKRAPLITGLLLISTSCAYASSGGCGADSTSGATNYSSVVDDVTVNQTDNVTGREFTSATLSSTNWQYACSCSAGKAVKLVGNDSNLLIVFYVQIMPDDFVMQLHRF